MTVLGAAAVLDLWEHAQGLAPVARAVALAAAAPRLAGDADDVGDDADVAALPLGQRDARLLRLRAALAGPALEATAPCPGCGEQVELVVDAAALLAVAGDRATPSTGELEVDGYTVRWRAPDSRAMAAAAEAGDPRAAEAVLLASWVTEARGPAGEVAAVALPDSVRSRVADAVAHADPLVEVLVDTACPSCAHAFVVEVDVAAFVWAELDARARRLLAEVDLLARAYGWSEAEVLALGEMRRAAYVRLALGDVS